MGKRGCQPADVDTASQKNDRRRKSSAVPFHIADDSDSEGALAIPLGAGLFAAILAIYVRTAYPSVPGGDAGELVFTSCSLGVAHPPGYPLYIMLGHLFVRYLPFGTPGFRVNCLSCVCGATATLIMFLFCQRWYASRGYRASCGLALVVAGSWALSPLLWQYHIQAEVFSLNNVFIMLQFLLAQLHHETCTPCDRSSANDTDAAKRKGRARTFARLGALAVGLGFSNQHAIVFYSLPIVLTVIINDASSHANVTDASFFMQLVACGLAGLMPYALMHWSASRGNLAQLGSWGDQRTISGLIKHFLRREYGTFRLYSGSDASYTSLFTWVQLYAWNLSENFLVVGPLLVAAGICSVLFTMRQERIGGLVAGSLAFYWITFHNLSNLPTDDEVLLGVHMRFWMQAHTLSAALMVPGAMALLKLVTGREPTDVTVASPLVLAAAVALVAVQGGLHYTTSDQSNNSYFERYGRSMLAGASLNAIVLSKGDNVVNTMRYLQRCENHRLDVRLVDQSMMSYEWFKTMHGPLLPDVEFPGDVAYFRDGALKAYSMQHFLDANYNPTVRNIYVCGGWKESDGQLDKDSRAFRAIAGYRTLPAGVCERVVTDAHWLSAHPTQVLAENRVLNLGRVLSKKHLKTFSPAHEPVHIPPAHEEQGITVSGGQEPMHAPLAPEDLRISVFNELHKYDERTWERSIHSHTQQALQRLGHWMVMWAQRNDDHTEAYELTLKIFRQSFEEWPETDLDLSAIGHRLWAISCSRLMNRRATAANLTLTKKVQKKDCNSSQVIANMRLYIQHEDRLNTDVEKQIVSCMYVCAYMRVCTCT